MSQRQCPQAGKLLLQLAAGTAVGAGQGTHEEHTKGLLLHEQFLSGEGRAGP